MINDDDNVSKEHINKQSLNWSQISGYPSIHNEFLDLEKQKHYLIWKKHNMTITALLIQLKP